MSKIKVNEIEPYSSAGVGIGSAPSDSSSLLELNSTTQGFKPPRMTTTQRNAIVSPSAGLSIYNTDNVRMETYDGTYWGSIGGSKLKNVIYVDVYGKGDFLTIKDAINSIVTASVSNPYLIQVGPGIYTEPQLSVPSYVSITGSSIERTVVQPDTSSHHVFVLNQYSEVSFLSVQNAGTGYAAFYCNNAGDYTQIHKVSIYNCDYGVIAIASTIVSNTYLEYVDINGFYTNAVKVVSTGGYTSFLNMENTYTFPDIANTATTHVVVDGTAAEVDVLSCGIYGTLTSNGFLVTNGGALLVRGSYIINCNKGVYADTNGSNPMISLGGISFEMCNYSFDISNTTATGSYTGYVEYNKKIINSSNSFFITNKDPNIITVSKKGGDFTSIASAVNSISGASSSNPYVVQVGPGVFTEPTITMKQWVTLRGSSSRTTKIVASVNTNPVIIASDNSAIYSLDISGSSGVGGVGVYGTAGGTDYTSLCYVSDCQFDNNTTHIKIDGSTGMVIIGANSCNMDTSFTNGLVVTTSSGHYCNLLWTTSFSNITNPGAIFSQVSGSGANITISNASVNDFTGSGIGIQASNGANVIASNVLLSGLSKGFYIQNVGVASSFSMQAMLSNITNDIEIDHPSATGTFTGSADYTKVIVNTSATVSMSYSDHGTAGQIVLQDLLQGSRQDRLINLSKLVRDSSTLGLVSGGAVTRTSGLGISIAGGDGFLIDPSFSFVKEITWSTTTLTLNASQDNYIYVDSSGTVNNSPSVPNFLNVVYLARCHTLSTSIDYIAPSVVNINQHGNVIENFERYALGPIYVSGSIVSENVVNPFQLDITGGNYYFGTKNYLPSGGTNHAFDVRFRSATPGVWTTVANQIVVNHTQYDDGTGTPHSLTAGYYAKHSFYTVCDGTEEKYFLVISQAQYDSLAAAQTANIPSPPPDFINSVTSIASIIVKQGAANITEIDDQRPRVGFKASSIAGVSQHANLSGLTTGDAGHTQFLMLDGSKSMTGPLNMGSQNVTTAGTYNSVTVEAHESRHLPNGADPLTTAAPLSNLTASTTNATGTANSLARSDHSHAISTATVVTQNTDQSNSAGSSANLARADHIHNIPTAVVVSIGAANAQGSSTSFARADHVHQIQTGNGITLSGTTVVPSYGTPITQNPDQTNTQGTTNTIADAGHIHNIPTAVPVTQNTDQTNTKGTSTSFARADHIHNIPTTTPVSQTPNQTNTQGTSTSFAKADHIHNIPTAAPSNQTIAVSTADGSANTFSRSDHLHTFSTAVVVSVGAANAQGTSTSFARADHIHNLVTSNGIVNSSGTISPSYGTPTTQNPDQTNTQGSTNTVADAGHVHAIVTAAASSQTPNQANAKGTSTSFARADHVHNIPTGSASTISLNANAQGSASAFSQQDHTHQLTASSATVDSIPQYDGSNWQVMLPENIISDLSSYIVLCDDFFTTNAATPFSQLGWSVTNTNGAPSVSSQAAVDNGHPGIANLSTGTNANGDCSLNLQTNAMLLGGGVVNMESLVYFPVLSVAGQDYFVRIGLGDGTTPTVNNGVYLQYRRTVAGNFWEYGTTNGGTPTLNTSSVAVAATTWYKISLVINATASSVSFAVNGTSLGSITTNIPTTNPCGPMIQIAKDSGATARSMYVDYYKLTQRFTTSR